MNPRLFSFVGGTVGEWRIVRMTTVVGDPLPSASRLSMVGGEASSMRAGTSWCLRGITSNERYVTGPEKEQLVAKQQGLGRPESL